MGETILIGKIYLVKTIENKIVPALCISITKDNSLLVAQIRTANKSEKATVLIKEKPKNKNKYNNEKVSKKLSNIYYIGKPVGLRDHSTVMVLKVHKLDLSHVVKELATLNEKIVQSVIHLRKKLLVNKQLHEEMHLIKKRIELARFNNENYTPLELRLDKILKELGYNKPSNKNKSKKSFLNYRDVPNKGHIKIYLGGR
jgi:hypothetical protein